MATVPGDTLTVDDAVDICEEILPAQSKSYELGLKLKLPQHIIEAIHSKDLSSEKYLLKIIISFLQQQGELLPTWRVIIDALRSPLVGLTALARDVERTHFPGYNASKTAANTTSDNAEVKSKPSQQKRILSDKDKTEVDLLPAMKKMKIDSETRGLVEEAKANALSRKEVQWPLLLNWKRKRNVPPNHKLICASSVVINEMVYCGGSDPYTLLQYNTNDDSWSKLPDLYREEDATITSFNGRLTTVGRANCKSYKIRMWDSGFKDLEEMLPFPPRGYSAALGYKNYIIIACGYYTDEVHVYDSTLYRNNLSGHWLIAQSVPRRGNFMSSAMVGDKWYLSSFGNWDDKKDHIYSVHLPTLISTATVTPTHRSSNFAIKIIWDELPTPPVMSPTLLDLHGHLLLIGNKERTKEIYRYDPDTYKWKQCGKLRIGLYAPCCAVLPSSELMVAGGQTAETEDSYSNEVWTTEVVQPS